MGGGNYQAWIQYKTALQKMNKNRGYQRLKGVDEQESKEGEGGPNMRTERRLSVAARAKHASVRAGKGVRRVFSGEPQLHRCLSNEKYDAEQDVDEEHQQAQAQAQETMWGQTRLRR